MILYLDTSALVKLYVEEVYSDQVIKQAGRAEISATSRIAYVETLAGIARKLRDGDMSRKEHEVLVGEFENDWSNFFVVEVTEEICRISGELLRNHLLRAFDAIHLASAVLLRRKIKEDVWFSSFDKRLNAAAQAEGLKNAD